MNLLWWKKTISLVILLASTIAVSAPRAAQDKGVIAGSVSDSSTGLGIQGAQVKLTVGLETLIAISDSTGKFLLVGVPEGIGFPVSIGKSGYHTTSIVVTVTDSIPSVVAVTMTDTYLQLLSPDGGHLIAGTEVEIRWDAVGIDALRIEYSPNSGRNWMLIASGVDAANGDWIWSVPDIPSEEAYIRISDTKRPRLSSQNMAPFLVTSN